MSILYYIYLILENKKILKGYFYLLQNLLLRRLLFVVLDILIKNYFLL